MYAGEKNAAAKLTDQSVRDIKRRLAKGASIRGLAKEYGVRNGTVDFIKAGKTWSHIEV